MITSEIKNFLNTQKLGYVATVSSDGLPNISPKGTIIAWSSEILAFADIRSPDTVKNLQNNPNVEINVIDPLYVRGICSKELLGWSILDCNMMKFFNIIEIMVLQVQ